MNKKVAVGVAAAVAAASIASNLAFTPEELLHDAAYLDSHTRAIQAGELGDYSIEYTEPEELGRADSLRAWLLRLPVPVKALLLLPLWALGAIPVAAATGAVSALGPIWSQVLGLLLQAAVLVGVFCAVYKLVFPKRKVRELFTKKKNRRWLLLGAFAAAGVNLVLSLAWSGWPAVRVVLLLGAGFGILCLLWRRICGGLKGPERRLVRRRLALEYPD